LPRGSSGKCPLRHERRGEIEHRAVRHHHVGVTGKGHWRLLEASLGQFRSQGAEPILVASTVIGADAPGGLDGRANFPDRAGVEFWELGSHVAKVCVGGVDVLTVTSCWLRTSTSAPASVIDGCVARRTPRIELCGIIVGTNAVASTVSVKRAVERVIVGWLCASFTPVNGVGVRANRLPINGPAIARFAADAATDRHPQAGLPNVAYFCSISARAGGVAGRVAMWPSCWRFPTVPLRKVAVNAVPRLRVDKIAVRCCGGEESKTNQLHNGCELGKNR